MDSNRQFFLSVFSDARTEFRQSNNLLFIFDRFDIFFSVIEASNCPVQTAIKCFDFLYECLEKLRRNLGVVLNKPPIIERSDLSNATKMYVYLFVNTIKVIDLQYTRSNEEKGMNNKKVIILAFRKTASYLFFFHSRIMIWENSINGIPNVKML